jgi:hypothetical protein
LLSKKNGETGTMIVKKTFKLPKRIETVMKIAITNKDREVSIAAA